MNSEKSWQIRPVHLAKLMRIIHSPMPTAAAAELTGPAGTNTKKARDGGALKPLQADQTRPRGGIGPDAASGS